MSAILACNADPAIKTSHHPSGQQLLGKELTACGTDQGRPLAFTIVCSLPAAEHFSPLQVAAALHVPIESSYAGTPGLGYIAWQLCELPGAKRMGAAQVQGLLEAAEDRAAATLQLDSNILAQTSASGVLKHIRNLPAARQLRIEAKTREKLCKLRMVQQYPGLRPRKECRAVHAAKFKGFRCCS
jgi:hypothetical protein